MEDERSWMGRKGEEWRKLYTSIKTIEKILQERKVNKYKKFFLALTWIINIAAFVYDSIGLYVKPICYIYIYIYVSICFWNYRLLGFE